MFQVGDKVKSELGNEGVVDFVFPPHKDDIYSVRVVPVWNNALKFIYLNTELQKVE